MGVLENFVPDVLWNFSPKAVRDLDHVFGDLVDLLAHVLLTRLDLPPLVLMVRLDDLLGLGPVERCPSMLDVL